MNKHSNIVNSYSNVSEIRLEGLTALNVMSDEGHM
jgi:hypothetical protein